MVTQWEVTSYTFPFLKFSIGVMTMEIGSYLAINVHINKPQLSLK